ncbi:MAG TPA: ABC transporter permease [Caulobacteraceae bacterium]|jgi:phospholipid/cholesterol/gamma-HCH transport system permease protein
MDEGASFRLERRGDGAVLALAGDWTAAGLGRTPVRLEREAQGLPAGLRLDFSGLGRFDTTGAYALNRAVKGKEVEADFDSRPDVRRLIDLVSQATPRAPRRRRKPTPLVQLLERVGRGMNDFTDQVARNMVFNGRLWVTLARSAGKPKRLRWAAIVNQMDSTGLDALPIIATLSFFIGAVIALLGANLLQQFGAQVYTVELIGIGVLREFGVMITAILLAGRSASSYAAAIGAMKMNQEIDALDVMGVDHFEALVLPRFLAMQLMVPLLTFVAVLAGLVGGMLVSWLALDLSPVFFLQRLLNSVGINHFWLGMAKAPVFAGVIAAIGARQGLQVGGDVESLGQHVTSAVVQSIFAIILIDALFALLYMELEV